MTTEGQEAAMQGWLSGYITGERAADNKLAEHVLFTLQRKIRRYGVPPQEADDLAQGCAIEVLRRVQEFDAKKGQFDAWLSGFALNAARMHRRTSAVKRQRDVSLEDMPFLPYEEQEHSDAKDRVAAALTSIDVLDRELLHMRFSLRLTSQEIAESSNMNAAQVRKRISRAVERLRRHPAIQDLLGA